MDELLDRIASNAGLDRQTAKSAVGHILAFVKAESESPDVTTMLDQTPGTEQAIREARETRTGTGGLLGGLIGAMGGQSAIMALGSKLMGLGLDVSQIRIVAKELIDFAEQHAGKDTVDRALQSVPGLGSVLT